MTILLLSLNIFNLFFFRKHWKKLFYLFLFFLPYLGYIQHQIQSATIFAPLIHDIVFLVPIFLFIIFDRKDLNFIPEDLKKLIFLFIVLLIIQLVNPYNDINFLGRLVGLKVWIFYFFMIAVGYHLILNKKDLKKFCNVFSIYAILPCLIGNVIYILFITYGYRETMILFYGDYGMAFRATQSFTQFDYGIFTYYRNPSTFIYSAQYLNFCLLAVMTTITSITLSDTLRESKFYKLLLAFIIISAFFTGNRGSIVYLSIFFIIFSFKHYSIKDIKFVLPKLAFLIIIITLLYKNFSMVEEVTSLGQRYALNTFFENSAENLSNYFFGSGLGNSTSGVRYINKDYLQMINEGLYWKVIVELGVFGLILFMSLFYNYAKQVKIVKIKLINYKEKVFCNCFYAYIIYQFFVGFKSWVYFEGYPANFMFFLILGIILKLGTNQYIENSYD